MRRQHGSAIDCFDQVLVLARETSYRNSQFEAHHGLGRVHHTTGHQHDAQHHHQTALHLAIDLNQPADQARAHDGLGHTHLALGNAHQARHHWQTALDLLTSIGTDHTEEPNVTTTAIRTHLHNLDNQ